MFWIALVALALASWSDLRTREIPDVVPAAVLACALGAALLDRHPLGWGGAGLGLAVGLFLGLLLFRTGQLGGGDTKLIVALGALLGAPVLILFLGASCLLGAVAGVLARRRGARELAFAPVMLLALLALVPVAWIL